MKVINLRTVNFSGYKQAKHPDLKNTTEKLKTLHCDTFNKSNAKRAVNFCGEIEDKSIQINHTDLREALT